LKVVRKSWVKRDDRRTFFMMFFRMFYRRRLFLTSAYFLCLLACLYGQNGKLIFDRLSVEQGLSQVTGNAVLQDRQGFMWFGTQNGLNRFNGYAFTIFQFEPHNPNSISDSYIWTIFEDRSGRIWIGTYNGGLNRFDSETESFTRFLNDPVDSFSLSHNTVRAVCQDMDGIIWVGTDNGLNKLDRDLKHFSRYIHDPENPNSISDNLILSLTLDSRGILWVGTFEGGLNKYSKETDDFIRYRHDPGNPNTPAGNGIRSICEDSSGMLWIGTINNGLDRFDPDLGTFTHYRHHPDDPHSLSENSVRDIFEDSLGYLWIGTESQGLNIFAGKKNVFHRYFSSPEDPDSISDNFIRSLYQDRSGTIWIGTQYNGFCKYNRFKKKFVHYKHNPLNPHSLSHNLVRAIYEDRSGTLWVGTAGGGLNRRPGDKDNFTRYIHVQEEPHSLSNNTVRAVCEDHDGHIWVGTGRGLNRFNRDTDTFSVFRHDPEDPNSLSNDQIISFLVDRSGTLWIGTNSGGLNRWNKENGTFNSFQHDPENSNSLCHNCAYTLFEDSHHLIWIGTEGGLSRLDPLSGSFRNYKYDPNDPVCLSQNLVSTIVEDRKGTLWFGTWGGGLNRFEQNTETFTYFSTKDGLPSNAISGILEDNAGNLWLSTTNGLAKFNPSTGRVRTYDVSDGLQSNGFNGGAYFKNKKGEMFFGGINGFNVFFPSEVKDNPYIPPIVLIKFKKFDKEVRIGKQLWKINHVDLTYSDTFFSFEFAALDYTDPSKNEYAYMLEGFDQDWIRCGTRRYVSYTNLDGGEYVFRVKGSNSDGCWNEEGLKINVVISPPFWEKSWFYLSCVLLAIFIFSVFIRIRTRRLDKMQRELQRMVDEQTLQLKEEKEKVEKANRDLARTNLELETLSLVASKTGTAVILTDAEGRIEWVNNSFTQMTGMTLQDLRTERGKTIQEASVNPKIRDILEQSVREKKSVIYESLIPNKEGEEICVSSTLTPIFDEADRLKKFVIIDADITDRKKAEVVLMEAKKMSETANQAKSLFLANMSHEIRTPMNGILGMTELAMDTDDPEEQREYLEMVRMSADSLLAIINDILDFSKIEAGKMDLEEINFSLRNCIGNALKTMAFKINEKGIDLISHIDPVVPDALLGDPGRLRQVLINLAGNAIKFTNQGEVVLRVHTEWEKEDEVSLFFSITDTGSGIPPLKQASIFLAFEQVDTSATRKYGGTGLGLAISSQLVRLMGGQIRVESPAKLPRSSKGGPGTTFHFTVRFKLQQEPSADLTIPSVGELKGMPILVVDDNKMALRFLEEILLKWGMRPELTENGIIALEKMHAAAAAGHPYKLVLLDSQMPEKDGFTTAAEIRKSPSLSETPIIMVTSSGQRGDSERCKNLRIGGYLMKPVRSIEITNTILAVLGVHNGDENRQQPITRYSLEEQQHRLKILLVEDNPVNQKLMQRLLEKQGHLPLVAEDGKKALALLENNEFDLIFMDLQMPIMDGFEATARIRKKEKTTGAHIPIIALTAYAMDIDRQRCLNAGMDAYLAKPIKTKELYTTLEQFSKQMKG